MVTINDSSRDRGIRTSFQMTELGDKQFYQSVYTQFENNWEFVVLNQMFNFTFDSVGKSSDTSMKIGSC